MNRVDYTIPDASVGGALITAARGVLGETRTPNRLAAHGKFMLAQAGPDRPGLIRDLTAVLLEYDGNIEAASQVSLRGLSTAMMVVSVPSFERQLALIQDMRDGVLRTSDSDSDTEIVCLRLPVDDGFVDSLGRVFGLSIDLEGDAGRNPNGFWMSALGAIEKEQSALAGIVLETLDGRCRIRGSILPPPSANHQDIESSLAQRLDSFTAQGPDATPSRDDPDSYGHNSGDTVSFLSLSGRARVGLIYDTIEALDSAGIVVIGGHMSILEGRSCAVLSLRGTVERSGVATALTERVERDFLRFSVFDVPKPAFHEWSSGPSWECSVTVVSTEQPGVLNRVAELTSDTGFTITVLDSRVLGDDERRCEVFFSLSRQSPLSPAQLAAFEQQLTHIRGVSKVEVVPTRRSIREGDSPNASVVAFSIEEGDVDLESGVLSVEADVSPGEGLSSVKVEVWADDLRVGTGFATLSPGESRPIEVRWTPVDGATTVNVLASLDGRAVWKQSIGGSTAGSDIVRG